MMFRHARNVIDAAHLEELRRQDTCKALERECRVLRRQFSSLEKDTVVLQAEWALQSNRLDSVVMQSGVLLTLINGLTCDEQRMIKPVPESKGALAALCLENKSLVDDKMVLQRRNAELELEISIVVAQLGSLLADYEGVRSTLTELKSAVSSATSIEELGGWVQL